MARTQKEYETVRNAEQALDSNDLEVVHLALFELLNMHQKLSRRIDKILKQSDKQEEVLIRMNDELCQIRDKQASDMSNMIAEQKKRASVILESKKRLLELHQNEALEYKSKNNELTTLLIEKNELEKRYALLQEEFKKLKLEYGIKDKKDDGVHSKYELDECLSELKSAGLEHFILETTKSLFEQEVLKDGMDNFRFSKLFLKLLNAAIQNQFLKKLHVAIPAEIMSIYTIKVYAEDILCVIADTTIEYASKKNRNALLFLSYYNGEVTLDNSGEKYKKPDIVDKQGNRWTVSSITQIYTQRVILLKQLHEKEVQVAALTEKLDSAVAKVEQAKHSLQKPDESKSDSDDQVAAESGGVKSGQQALSDLLSSDIGLLTEEAGNIRKLFNAEKSRVLIIRENLNPLEEKYDMILTACVKAMLQLVGKK